MKTGRQTTYFLLERGDEDRRLFDEIARIQVLLDLGREFYVQFPVLAELRQGLRKEMDRDDD